MTLSQRLVGLVVPISMILFSISAGATASSPFSDSDIKPSEVEGILMEGCLENDKNTPEQCQCALGGLKKEMPSKDYGLMMEFLSIAMNANFGGIWDFIVENDMTLSELKAFGERADEAADKIERDCGSTDLNIRLDLGNRKSV